MYFISEILALPQRIDQQFELVLQLAWLLGFISHSHYSTDNFIIICLKYNQYGVQFYGQIIRSLRFMLHILLYFQLGLSLLLICCCL